MESTLLTPCDLEPIHLPSAIQSFGVLIVVDLANHRVLQVSKNSNEYTGRKDSECLGDELKNVLGSGSVNCLKNRQNRFYASCRVANVYYQEELALIEIENNISIDPVCITASLDLIQSTVDLQGLLAAAALAVSNLTRLDRVMIYQFHNDLHGEVVAEVVQPGVESYFGLHYPASDIPLPARAVLLKTWVRMSPNAASGPVGLQPVLNPRTQKPLDLGASLLRAVSPVHLEYLNNMKVGASLTISLVVRGKLWGLIACHHREKSYLGVQVRDACESIGRLTSAFISVRSNSDRLTEVAKYEAVHEELVKNLHQGNNVAEQLTNSFPNLLDLIASGGSAAALYLEGYWSSVGVTPESGELDAIVKWLIENHPDEVLFCTEDLISEYPSAHDFAPAFCGLMALSIPKAKSHYVLWFRPERITTIPWAGKPEKIADESGRLHPRESFSLWLEELKGQSAPWTSLEKEAALTLRNAILSLDLQKQYLKEQEARIEAERAIKAREELMEVLSHDLKNPLGSIRLGVQFATQFLTADSFEKVRPYLDRIEKTTANMDLLISDILSITKLEAGFNDATLAWVNLNDLLVEVIELVTPIVHEKKITLGSEFEETLCETLCDRGQIFQVISNILGNAIKFTPVGGTINIVLQKNSMDYLRFKISDSGPGIPPENLPNIFDRFWQAQKTKRLGTGIGLAIVKAILTAHQGRVWAESDGKNGTTFFVELPMLKPYAKA